MAVSNLWRGFSGAHAQVDLTSDGLRHAVLEDFEQTGLAWIWSSDAEGILNYLSPAAADALGIPLHALLGHPLTGLFETDPDDPDNRSGRPLGFQIKARNRISDVTVRCALPEARTGKPVWLLLSGQPKIDSTGRFHGYRGWAKDISVEYQRKIEDSRLAEFDSLTGLYNRHRMNRRLESMLAAFRAAKRTCALMMLDLDRFKQVNDTGGHAAGDEMLCQVAALIRSSLRSSDLPARLGGDEFAILLPGCDSELATRIATMIREGIESICLERDGRQFRVGASVGVSATLPGDTRVSDLMERADAACYQAKSEAASGRELIESLRRHGPRVAPVPDQEA